MKPMCSVAGCAKPHNAKGFCIAHYSRWRRTGDPGPAEIWDKKPKTCSVDGCETVARSLGMCNVHHLRWSRHGDLGRDNHKSNHVRWVERDRLTYDAAHDRVKRYRGVASSHACACGSLAEDWAYLHTDPDPLLDERGLPFSDDIAAYAAMCRSCHKAFDWQHKREQIAKDEQEAAS